MGDIDLIEKVKRPVETKKGDDDDESDKQCVVCFSGDPDAIVMECGHGSVCHDCAVESWKKDDDCPFCRKPIGKVLKIKLFENIGVAKVITLTRKRPFAFLLPASS